VALSGTRKAALLLSVLDTGTAAELLRSARPDVLTEITAELVHLNALGGTQREAVAEPAKDFFGYLQQSRSGPGGPEAFVRHVLETVVGKQRGEEMLGEARRLVDVRDPFLAVRDATVEDLSQALVGEHPQVAAMVLIELPLAKSAALIPLLEGPVQSEAVRRMTSGETVTPEARARVAAMVRSRLEEVRKAQAQDGPAVGSAAPAGAVGKKSNARLRMVSLLLRGLATDLRDALVKSIGEKDPDTASAVQKSMVLWEDLPVIADRSLQVILRNVDARKLALALVGAERAAAAKIRMNISERAQAMIDEETQLMKKPKVEDIEAAREAVLGHLRELNASGELQFEG